MAWKTQDARRWYHQWFCWIVLVLTAVCFFGWPKLKNYYQRWNASRQVQRAAASIAQGEFKRAMLEARSALETNPMDPNATRSMAEALEKAGGRAAAAQWRRRLDSIAPGDLANLLAWASDLQQAGDIAGAERVLAMLNPAPKDDAGYHATAAGVAAARRDIAGAEQHWAEASRLVPKDDNYRLNLAILRLRSKSAEVRAGALDILTAMSGQPPKNLEALRVLLADAAEYRDWGRALEFADALVADPGATFADKLARLATLRGMKSGDATGYLSELRDAALAKCEDVYLLFMWMNQHDLALLVAEWARMLPQDVSGVPPVCVAVAEAYIRGSDWSGLRAFLDVRPWGDQEYMRRAFLSRAQERLNSAEMSAEEWKDGITLARGRGGATQRLERMVKLAISWGWEQRAQEVMWSMAGSPNCPRWMLDALWLIAIESRDTAQLQRLAGLLVLADARSAAFRNSFAFYALLAHSEDGNPHREAERLFAENPGDSSIVLTRALSLHLLGKSAEAGALTGALPATELMKPRIALYHAIFLTAAGEGAKAAEFLTAAEDWKMFPEEKALLERARVSVAKEGGEQEVVETSKAMRVAKAARDLEVEKAVEEARTARAAKVAKETEEAKALAAARAEKAARAAQAARDPVALPGFAR